MTTGTAGTTFYLAKDGDRICWLVAVQGDDAWSAKAYGYVPDLAAFVFNGPLTLDFRIDRELTYEAVTPGHAAQMIDAGQLSRLDEADMHDLLEEMRSEPRKLAAQLVHEHNHP